MATVTCGTSSRDYSTITAAEAATSSGDVIECYDDSAFDEAFTINAGQTLTVASGERHDGTAGSGARVVRTGLGVMTMAGASTVIVEWLELDANEQSGGSSLIAGAVDFTVQPIVRNCLIHGHRVSAGGTNAAVNSLGRAYTLLNNAFWNNKITRAGSMQYACIYVDMDRSFAWVANNTVYGTGSTDAGHTGPVYGIDVVDSATGAGVQNNIVIGTYSDGSGTATDFQTWSSATNDHNASEDSSAAGTGSLTGVTNSVFVSTTSGSEDLHLSGSGSVIGGGADLGTTDGVEIDIDGSDRDALGVTWDMGAHQLLATGSPLLLLLHNHG